MTTARHVAWLPRPSRLDGRWLATGATARSTARTKVWDAHNKGGWADPPHHLRPATPRLFSPNGQWLVTAHPQVYRFWHVGSCEPGPSIEREQGGTIAGSMAFSPDGRLLKPRTGTQATPDARMLRWPTSKF